MSTSSAALPRGGFLGAAEHLSSGYISLVMATGIVAIACHLQGFVVVPEVLGVLNWAAYVNCGRDAHPHPGKPGAQRIGRAVPPRDGAPGMFGQAERQFPGAHARIRIGHGAHFDGRQDGGSSRLRASRRYPRCRRCAGTGTPSSTMLQWS
jgi:hypothetical protein